MSDKLKAALHPITETVDDEVIVALAQRYVKPALTSCALTLIHHHPDVAERYLEVITTALVFHEVDRMKRLGA